jgi:predicted nuclease of predicted toxin-antitoxin system
MLIDECAPQQLQTILVANGFDCISTQEAGWGGKENGELLALANRECEVFVTLDRKLRYQQNLTGLKIAIVGLHARSNRLGDLQPSFGPCIQALRFLQPGTIVEIGSPS